MAEKDRAKRAETKTGQAVEQINQPLAQRKLDPDLERNRALFQELFRDDDTLVLRELCGGADDVTRYLLVYCDGLIDSALMNDNLVRPLQQAAASQTLPPAQLQANLLQSNDVKSSQDVEEMVRAITFGDCLVLAQGHAQGLLVSTKGFVTRSVAEPESERILSGPREGFTESLMQNLSMLHRKLRTNSLKLKMSSVGEQTGTQLCVCWLEGVATPRIVQEVQNRLETIQVDGVLDSNHIAELIQDSSRSPFRASGTTERPDVVAGKLLEGRVAILVDGSPVALTLPYLFVENFQSGEDYYLNYWYASFSRLLRMLGFFLSVVVPGFYIALICYRPEIIPEQLFISVAAERQSVPLSAPLEMIAMLIIFDILREAGVRMPSNVGQALSIVGALVIGQTAVEAQLVASTMLIVVATTGVTSLLVPRMNMAVIASRTLILLLSSVLGLYGFMLGLCCVLIHILSLRTMDMSQVRPDKLADPDAAGDLMVRLPWWHMRRRPPVMSVNPTRADTEESR